jgi:GxxExxY protein
MKFDKLSNQVIGCALEVHKHLGPGLLESTYEQCLAHELTNAGIPVNYKGIKLDCGYRVDLFIDRTIIVELKNVDRVLPVHQGQLLTYMKLSGISIGLLLNFNVKFMKHGIK